MKEYQQIADLLEVDGQAELRSGSGRLKGSEYIRFLNERGQEPLNLGSEQLEERRKVLEAFLQRGREFQTFVPGLCLKGFTEGVLRGEFPQENDAAYKGVSYNPNLIKNGEKLDNLDFFAWAARLQKEIPGFELKVLDASPYQVLNELGEVDWPEGLSDEEFPAWFYGQIEKGVAASPELSDNCKLRGQYLRAMMQATGVKGEVISALDLIKSKDPILLDSMREAREICGAKIINNKLAVDRPVYYRRNDSEFSKSYTPAVIAEAIYFLRANGIRSKLGPVSEVEFDNLIAKCIRDKASYNFFWYTRPFEKGASTENRVYFNDSPDQVRTKLKDPKYSAWVSDITSDFSQESDVSDRVLEIMERVQSLLTK